jgi:hypothetical protein
MTNTLIEQYCRIANEGAEFEDPRLEELRGRMTRFQCATIVERLRSEAASRRPMKEIEPMRNLELTEPEKALAMIVDADLRPQGAALVLVFFGVVTAELDPVAFRVAHGFQLHFFLGEDWFDDYVRAALDMGGMLAVQKFGIDPASFPGSLAMFLGGGVTPDAGGFLVNVDQLATPVPVFLVGDRLITWGNREGTFYATDKLARASEMRAAFAKAESNRMGEATH